jgi:hypothetical protein
MCEYTLRTSGLLFDQRRIYFWQRDIDGVYPDKPLVFDIP